MPTYIAMLKWTQQGIKDVKQSASRLDAARKSFRAAGVNLKEFYMVMGHHDAMTIIEAPDDATLAAALLSVGALGSVTTETYRAFAEEEFRQIIARLG